ncbi:MAG: TetR/AcrR family transcriptional regulator [Erysipelotrichaceae bacterium]|nr:TetR/AcrR family transcriptional regulator [Erysipelotrichaceae bacterium]
MSTREKILDAALTLFAKNGYDGTSMEEISSEVGIKAPSLYKHFKGKEDIFNTLLDNAEARYEENFGSAENAVIPDSIESFIISTMKSVSFTISDPMIRKIRIFLIKEQFRNERLADITTRHQILGLQKMYTKIVEGMMKKGLLKKDDPSLIAMELIAPVVLYVSRTDREPGYRKEALKTIEKHLRHVCGLYAENSESEVDNDE